MNRLTPEILSRSLCYSVERRVSLIGPKTEVLTSFICLLPVLAMTQPYDLHEVQ